MKKLIFLSFLFIFIIVKAYAQNIKDIEVKGNERITKETIILFSGLSKNEKIDNAKLNQTIKNLYSSDFFENVSVSFVDQKIIIEVKENPIIQSVKFEGIKKNTIIDALRENIKLKEKNSFIKNRVKKDEELITNILKSNGYYFAEVKTKYKENSNNTINLIFNINLGDKAFIKKIKFIGDKKFKDRKLRSVIISEEAKFWKFISNRKYLDIKRIKLDEKLLVNYFKNRGYFDVSVKSSSARIINESDFELIFNINSGKKFNFGNLNLTLPEDYEKKNFVNLESLLSELEGKVYSLNKIEDILDEIDDIVLIQEFQFANVKYKEVVKNNNININFSIEDGDKIYIQRIDIFGNFITEEKVVRNSLLIDEGDALNEILWSKSINEVKSKNVFSEVNYKILNSNDISQKNIEIYVEEKPTGEISAGAGTGTSGSSISFGLKEGNYLGKGVKVNSGITISDESITGLLSINNPNYKNSDRSLITSLESTEKDQMSRYGYKNMKTGFSLGTNYEQFKDVYFTPTISTYYESLETSSKASAAKKKQEGDYFETQFRYGLTLNRLNQNFQPTEGSRTSFYQTIPLYTDDNTLENMFKFSKYYSLKDEMIFSLKFYTKAVNSLTGDDVRVTKRVFIPSRQLRGFERGKIGPQDGGDYIGGNYGASLNFAATLPKLLPEFEEVDFSIFLDLANVWGVDYNDSLDDNKLRSSTGLAIDWFTPIGPLSLSISQPITKSNTDKTEKIRFNIGTTF